MKKLAFAIICLLGTLTTFAQPCRGLVAAVGFKHNPEADHLIFARFDFWCHASKTVPLKRFAEVDFGATGRDFRDLKSVTFIDGPGSPADQEITGMFLIGPPLTGVHSRSSPDDVKPKFEVPDTVGANLISQLQTQPLLRLEDIHVPFSSSKPVTFNITREGMDDNPTMYGRLKVRLKVEDGGRKESVFKFFLETTDGQMIELPVDRLTDGETKDIDLPLQTPVPANGIKRIHAWFNHRGWNTNTSNGKGDLFQDDDDAKVIVSIVGEGRSGTGTLGRASLQMTDWGNATSRDLSDSPKTYADMFLSNLEVMIETGKNELNYRPNTFPSFKCSVTLNRNVDLIKHTTGVFAHNHPGSTFFGEFRSGCMARAVSPTGLPNGFKLSDVSELVLSMDAGTPIPRDYTGRVSEPWDVNMLLIRAIPKSTTVQPWPLVFANFTLNQTLRYNLNVNTGGVRTIRARLEGTPIKYRVVPVPTR